MNARRAGGLAGVLIAVAGTVYLVAYAVAGTGAYFTDVAAGSIGGFLAASSATPTPPTPDECAGGHFDQVIVGTPGDDHIVAANGGALIFGLGGNDTLEGGNGKDCLVGGDGNDTLVGGNGKDTLLGGEGDDTLYGGGDDDVVDGGNGKDAMNGGAGTDACYGTKKDRFEQCETTSTGSAAPIGAAPVTAPDPATALDPGPTPSPDLVTPSAEPSADAPQDPSVGPSTEPGPSSEPSSDGTPQPDPSTATSPDPGAAPTPTPEPAPSTPPNAEPAPPPSVEPAPAPVQEAPPSQKPTPEPTAQPTPAAASSGGDPVVDAPVLRLAELSSTPTSGVPAVVSWSLADSQVAVLRYDLQVRRDGGSFATLALPSSRATSQVVTMQAGHTYTYRVRALGMTGGAGPWESVGPNRGLVVPDTSSSIEWTGTWSSIELNAYLGGSAHSTGGTGATATLRFDGTGVAWAGPVGPTRGKAQVYLDGRLMATVDLWAPSFQPRQVVFAAGVRDGAHTLVVKGLGTAGRSTVNIDSIYVVQPD